MPTEPHSRSHRRWVWSTLTTLAIALGVGLFVIPHVPSKSLPDLNAYEDLVAAGQAIEGQFPNQGDWTRADLAALRDFVAKNEPVLRRVRLGIGREGLAVFADSHQGLDDLMRRQGQIRTLTRLLFAAARLAYEDGRFADQVRSRSGDPGGGSDHDAGFDRRHSHDGVGRRGASSRSAQTTPRSARRDRPPSRAQRVGGTSTSGE